MMHVEQHRVCVRLVPIGRIPRVKFEQYMNEIMKIQQIGLENLHRPPSQAPCMLSLLSLLCFVYHVVLSFSLPHLLFHSTRLDSTMCDSHSLC
jgi:hypothetical protein